MDRSIQFTLLPVTNYQDSIGQFVGTESPRLVFGQVTSVSADEFFSGGQNGFRPEYRVTMFAPDYHKEKRCILFGEEYSIYRVYYGRKDSVELYLEKRTGD